MNKINSKNPIISIITVSYNSKDTIEKSIKSVVMQSYKYIEYIIIDGASNDGTVDIIKKYDSYISKWISEPDTGIYHAMNKGIDMATGDLIGFLSSNDWYAEGAIESVAKKYSEDNSDVIYGDIVVIDGDIIISKNYKNVDLSEFAYIMPIIHPGLFVKRDIQSKYRFDQSYRSSADAKFFMQVYKAGYKFEYVEKKIAFYNLGGISSNYCVEPSETLRAAKEVNGEMFYSVKNKAFSHYYLGIFRGLMKEPKFVKYASKKIGEKYKNKFIVFGAGEKCAITCKWLQSLECNIIGIVDSDKIKIGKSINGIAVRCVDELQNATDCVVIISSTKYSDEMRKSAQQLIKCRDVILLSLFELSKELVISYETIYQELEIIEE